MGAAHDHSGHDHAGHDHGHSHSHGHSHGHGHVHAPANFGRAFAIGIALNLAYVIVEAGYGFATDSLALIADAGHNLSDVLALAVAWGAAVLSRRRPSARFTYGLRGSSILAALFNAIVLLVAVGAIAWEAVQRFADPPPVAGATVMVVAAAGIAVNGVTAWLFSRGSKGDINVRAAFQHMLADAAVSAAVVVAGLLILLTHAEWIDPAICLVVSVVIVAGTWGLLRDSVTMALQAVPPGIDLAAVEAWLGELPGVTGTNDLHVWSMSTTEVALTTHLLMPGGAPPGFLGVVAKGLHDRFDIDHSTVQVETDPARCALERTV